MNHKVSASSLFFVLALLMLAAGLVFGVLAAGMYVMPAALQSMPGFEALRPMHVSSVVFWILLASTACIYGGLQTLYGARSGTKQLCLHAAVWILAAAGVFASYLKSDFGGREYWEFNPVWAFPVLLAWLLLMWFFFRHMNGLRQKPVYVWMWMTGVLFFLFTFLENYLWILPYFRNRLVTDMAVQWKVNGSLVGAWNQIVYGTAFFLMDKIKGNRDTGSSRMAFAMYFLGLFNLMFNWGHHVYALPVPAYVRIVGYAVSMTEWVFFARIVYSWKQSIYDIRRYNQFLPFRFLMAADVWVFLNMGQAILMSVPALNLYTHGTHVTVAHAMGTTIGINTMILFAAAFSFLPAAPVEAMQNKRLIRISFWGIQLSLLLFWLSLNTAGVLKGFWMMQQTRSSFAAMMDDLRPFFILFLLAGLFLLVFMLIPAIALLRLHLRHLRAGSDVLFLKSDENIRNNLPNQ